MKNKTYKITADVWLGTLLPDPTTAIHMHLGSIQRIVPDLTTTRRTYTWYGTTTSTNDMFFFHDDADENEDGTFFIDNVSVQLVNGNTGTLS